jgi:hypothetical protein
MMRRADGQVLDATADADPEVPAGRIGLGETPAVIGMDSDGVIPKGESPGLGVVCGGGADRVLEKDLHSLL